MKHFSKRLICSLLAVCMLSCSLFASAAVETSAYLDSHSATLTALSGGRIAVTVDVAGVGRQDKIGASEIHIYESTNNEDFEWAASYYAEDNTDFLWSSSTHYYDSPVTYEGTPGRYYKAWVYFYAEKDGGSDTEDYMTVSCRAIS